eukprot:g14908.t1
MPRRGRESQFIQDLRHPNLVNVLAIVQDEQLHYVVLELCTGGNLQDVIHKEDSPWESVPSVYRLRGGYDILLALDYIHQQGVLHRDIKSGNAFLHTPIVEGEALPTVKVGDMGFARPLSDYDAMTQGVGTLRYMAPEVLNSGEYNVTADMFSFRNIPFQSRNEASLCLAILGGHRPPYEELFVDTSLSEEQIGVVWALMEACWQEDADERTLGAFGDVGIVMSQRFPRNP